MDTAEIRAISLFSGGGGLDAGVAEFARSIGADCRVVAYCEREAFAAEVLAAQMDAGRLDAAPIWTDVASFDGVPFRGLVDAVIAGWPCPPYSSAPRGRNCDDDMWQHVVRIAREIEPRYLFLENVATIAPRLGPILRDLHALGLNAEWSTTSATEVGADHDRRRMFLLAYANGKGESPITVDAQMAGIPETPEPSISRAIGARMGGANGMADRVDRLRLLGNGVVPRQAAAAYRELWSRLA